ncbi:MAG: CotH kinase family protein [Muribaculaceae bacterium]|nr:CotH kinase family protein [Muribaculaceae bacterium]
MLRKLLATLAIIIASTSARAQDPWLHLYYPDGSNYQAFDMNEVLEINFDELTGTMTINGINGASKAFAKSLDHFEINPNVAALFIDTDNADITEITSKVVYEDATLTFKGRGLQPDYSERVKIRGRGNSTWSYSKKPYRLKFSEKQRLLLPKKAKNFALLANYIDPSMMRNFVAFKFGQIIGMPWINHCEPVDVYLNGIYKGSYMITEKVGFNNGSVNLKAADEPNSIMLELDTNGHTDDDIYFESNYYDSDNGYYFPVIVKDPDAPEDPDEKETWINGWIADFDRFMEVVDSGSEDAIFEACDLESLVRFMMVFDICCNQEIDHPKSVFVYKTRGGKWNFGPCWDFDWAFGYSPTYSKGSNGWWGQHSESYETPLRGLGGNGNPIDGHAGVFFYKLCRTEAFQKRFKELWNEFYLNQINEFWDEFDAYAERLRPSANLQGLTRSQYQKFDTNVEELRQWVANRFEYINTDANHGLWESNTFSKF